VSGAASRLPTASELQLENKAADDRKIFSQQLDVAALIGSVGQPTSAWYKIKDAQGAVLQEGAINADKKTQRFFTASEEQLTAYIGDGAWRFFADVAHATPIPANASAQQTDENDDGGVRA
jgi:hypothetical protein